MTKTTKDLMQMISIAMPGRDVLHVTHYEGITLRNVFEMARVTLQDGMEVRVNGTLVGENMFDVPLPANAQILIAGQIRGALC